MGNFKDTTIYRKKVSRGVIFVSVTSIITRLLSIVTGIILARILLPNDFGLLAIALTIITFSEGATQTGFNSALVQKQDNPQEYFNIAWSFEVIRGTILTILMYILSPLIAKFFDDSRIINIVRVLSIMFILTGFKNVGVIWFRKNLDFKKQSIFDLIPLLIKTVVIIPLALLLKNVWALVWGNILFSFSTLILSYCMYPKIPRFELDFKRAKELFSFGKWILASYIIAVINKQCLTMFIGKVFNMTVLGFYNRAEAFTRQIFFQINEIYWKVGFPAMANISSEKKKLKTFYLLSLRILAVLGFPLLGGFFVLSWEFTHLLLTDKWISIVPLLQIFALYSAVSLINTPSGVTFQSLGLPKISTNLNLLSVSVLIITIYPFTKYFGIVGATLSLLISILFVLPLGVIKLSKLINFSLIEFIAQLLYPLISTFIMIISILLIKKYILPINTIIILFVFIIASTLIYLTSLFIIEKRKNFLTISLIKSIFLKK